MLVMIITVNYFGTDLATLAIGAVIGVVAAAAAVMLIKPAIIVATAIAGAYALTLSLFRLIPDMPFDVLYFPILIGIAGIGTIFQIVTTKNVD